MSRRLLLLSATLLGCLPISVERDHPIEGYALNQFDPRHIAATGQIVCAATGADGPTRCWGALGAPWRTHELPFTIPGDVALAQVAVSDNWICGLDSQACAVRGTALTDSGAIKPRAYAQRGA